MADTKYTGYVQSMSRSVHRATEALTSISLIFPNWGLGSSGDVANNASATLQCSIEYPVGAFTQLKFSQSNIGNAAPGANFVTDFISVNIPKGAFFWVRSLYTSTSSTGIYGAGAYNGLNFSPYYEGSVWSTTANLSNLVMATGTGGSSGNNDGFNKPTPIYRPIAIVQMTSRPSVFVTGDSISAGLYDLPDAGGDAAGFFGRAIPFGTINAGRAGEWVTGLVSTNYQYRSQLAQYCSHVVTNYGTNDMTVGGYSAAQIVTSINTFYSTWFSGKPFFVSTILPTTPVSSDGWNTTVNQTVGSKEAVRLALNDSIRSGAVTAVNVIDLDKIWSSGNGSGLIIAAGLSQTLTSAVTNSTVNITYASNTGVYVGMTVSGPGIPLKTVIASVPTSTSAVMNNAATASASGLTLTAYSTMTWDGLHPNHTGYVYIASQINPAIFL